MLVSSNSRRSRPASRTKARGRVWARASAKDRNFSSPASMEGDDFFYRRACPKVFALFWAAPDAQGHPSSDCLLQISGKLIESAFALSFQNSYKLNI
jgi:hypothetical protein